MEAWRYTPEILTALKLPSDDEKYFLHAVIKGENEQ